MYYYMQYMKVTGLTIVKVLLSLFRAFIFIIFIGLLRFPKFEHVSNL